MEAKKPVSEIAPAVVAVGAGIAKAMPYIIKAAKYLPTIIATITTLMQTIQELKKQTKGKATPEQQQKLDDTEGWLKDYLDRYETMMDEIDTVKKEPATAEATESRNETRVEAMALVEQASGSLMLAQDAMLEDEMITDEDYLGEVCVMIDEAVKTCNMIG